MFVEVKFTFECVIDLNIGNIGVFISEFVFICEVLFNLCLVGGYYIIAVYEGH